MKHFGENSRTAERISETTISVLSGIILCQVIFGCNVKLSNDPEVGCTPSCNVTNECQSDGCGGMCECLNYPEEVCNLEGECVPNGDCADGCGDRECGSVCGEPCGSLDGLCPEGQDCVQGYCGCAPTCDGIHCGQDDGCGGACGCPAGKACDLESGLCRDSTGACDNRECGTWDGEYCGACTGGQLCDADGRCVDDCNDLCSDVGWECDESICHDECGTCPGNEVCVNHVCVCRPNCESGSCDDGCGGTCGCDLGYKCDINSGKCVQCTASDTCGDMECGDVCGYPCGNRDGECAAGESCVEGYCYPSTLSMTLVESELSEDDGRVYGTLQIDYAPRPSEPAPRMADLRLATDRNVNLEVDSVTLAGAGTAARKSLYEDPITLMPWRYRPDGAIQMLIHTAEEDLAHAENKIGEGVLLVINFVLDLEDDNSNTAVKEDKVKISLVRRNQTLAPFDADIALQETAYDQPVVVTK